MVAITSVGAFIFVRLFVSCILVGEPCHVAGEMLLFIYSFQLEDFLLLESLSTRGGLFWIWDLATHGFHT